MENRDHQHAWINQSTGNIIHILTKRMLSNVLKNLNSDYGWWVAIQIIIRKITYIKKNLNGKGASWREITWLGGMCFPLRRSRRTVPKLKMTLSGVTLPTKGDPFDHSQVNGVKVRLFLSASRRQSSVLQNINTHNRWTLNEKKMHAC